jgi:hypothetical protein
MDPSSAKPSVPEPQINQLQIQPSQGTDSSTNKQAIMFVGGVACLLLIAASFAYYFLFLGPYAGPGSEVTLLTTSYESEPTPAPPTPTPTVNPWVIIKQAYANPFDDETQYTNPFEESNPFEELE